MTLLWRVIVSSLTLFSVLHSSRRGGGGWRQLPGRPQQETRVGVDYQEGVQQVSLLLGLFPSSGVAAIVWISLCHVVLSATSATFSPTLSLLRESFRLVSVVLPVSFLVGLQVHLAFSLACALLPLSSHVCITPALFQHVSLMADAHSPRGQFSDMYLVGLLAYSLLLSRTPALCLLCIHVTIKQCLVIAIHCSWNEK